MHFIAVLILAIEVYSIPKTFPWPANDPRLFVDPRRGVIRTLTKNPFREYLDSQLLCRTEYKLWWDAYEPVRSALTATPRYRDLLGPVADRLPYVYYDRPPVQAMGFTPGSIDAIMTNDMGYGRPSRFCKGTCEDERSKIELFISQSLALKQEVRYIYPVIMLCPEDWKAVIYYADDDREELTDEMKQLEEELKAYSVHFRPDDFQEYTNMLYPERVVGELVSRCRCLPEHEYRIKQLLSQHTKCVDSAPVANKEQQVTMWVAQEGDHPYREGSTELERATEFWMTGYPESSEAENETFRLHGPATEFTYPGKVAIGTIVRGCAHANYLKWPLMMGISLVNLKRGSTLTRSSLEVS